MCFDLYCVNAVCLGHMGYSVSLQPGTFSVDIVKQLQKKHHNKKKKHPKKSKGRKIRKIKYNTTASVCFPTIYNVGKCVTLYCFSLCLYFTASTNCFITHSHCDGFRTGVFAFFAPQSSTLTRFGVDCLLVHSAGTRIITFFRTLDC